MSSAEARPTRVFSVWVQGLPETFDATDALELAADFGEPIDAYVTPTKRSVVACLVFTEEWEAETALSELDGSRFEGRRLEASMEVQEVRALASRTRRPMAV